MMTTVRPTTITLGDKDVPRIGLGTNRLTESPEHLEFVRDAATAGIGVIDTAHTYTGGESESTIGGALSAAPADCVVATKGGYAPGTGRPDALRGQIEESQRRLRTDRIELYYLHRIHPDTPVEDTLGAVKEHVDAGRIGHVGLSQVDVEMIERARRLLPIAAVQNHYNLSERRYDDVIDHCEREGIVFLPYFPLQGTVQALDRVAEAHDATPAQIRLAWLLQRSPVMLPIPGTLALEHVRENLAALDIELTDQEFEAVA